MTNINIGAISCCDITTPASLTRLTLKILSFITFSREYMTNFLIHPMNIVTIIKLKQEIKSIENKDDLILSNRHLAQKYFHKSEFP